LERIQPYLPHRSWSIVHSLFLAIYPLTNNEISLYRKYLV